MNYKSRKFLLTVGSIILVYIALIMNRLSQTNFIDVFKWIFIAYMGGNVVHHFTNKKGKSDE